MQVTCLIFWKGNYKETAKLILASSFRQAKVNVRVINTIKFFYTAKKSVAFTESIIITLLLN